MPPTASSAMTAGSRGSALGMGVFTRRGLELLPRPGEGFLQRFVAFHEAGLDLLPRFRGAVLEPAVPFGGLVAFPAQRVERRAGLLAGGLIHPLPVVVQLPFQAGDAPVQIVERSLGLLDGLVALRNRVILDRPPGLAGFL